MGPSQRRGKRLLIRVCVYVHKADPHRGYDTIQLGLALVERNHDAKRRESSCETMELNPLYKLTQIRLITAPSTSTPSQHNIRVRTYLKLLLSSLKRITRPAGEPGKHHNTGQYELHITMTLMEPRFKPALRFNKTYMSFSRALHVSPLYAVCFYWTRTGPLAFTLLLHCSEFLLF